MAASNWPACFRATLGHEGGYVDHPLDPGGATNLGITRRTLSRWLGRPVSKAEVRALTPSAVAPIYRRNYWDAVRGDDLPAGVDLVTYDAGVNSGVRRGARWTQRACGSRPDGVVGPRTLEALERGSAKEIVKAATGHRLAFLQGLSTWRVFGRGWGRRVGEVRALGLQMAGSGRDEIREDASGLGDRAARDRLNAGRSGGGTAAAGGGAAAADQVATLDWGALATLGLVAVALLALAVFLAARSRAGRDAAAAMLDFLNRTERPT